jgi:hypothetical protein
MSKSAGTMLAIVTIARQPDREEKQMAALIESDNATFHEVLNETPINAQSNRLHDIKDHL